MRHIAQLVGLILAVSACSDSVLEPEPVELTRIELSEDDLSLMVFDVVQLTATAFDTQGRPVSSAPITWSSSEPEVVTVDAGTGTLEAKGAGTAVVTAESAGVSATLTVDVRVGTITFERYPTGESACDRCALSDQYEEWGVLFSFYSDPDLNADTTLTLVRTGERHPGDSISSHMVSGATTSGGGAWVGVSVIMIPSAADSVRLVAEVNHSVGDIPVRAYAADGTELAAGAITVESSVVNRLNSGFDFRRDLIKIADPAGVARVELDGRNKSTGSARGGFGILFDDLTIWPDGER